MQRNADAILNSALSGADNIAKANKETVDNIRKPYVDMNEFYLVDPLKIETKIKELEESIGTFKTDIDAILSESNATTFITI